jgi:uroporphyrinogen-III synthase
MIRRLEALGAIPITFPVIAIAPPEPGGLLDQAIQRLDSYDWIIFTSVNGVEHFWQRLDALGAGSEEPGPDMAHFNGKIAAIGPATASILKQYGMQVELIPDEYTAEGILDTISGVSGCRILLPRADIARPALAQGLAERGAVIDEVPAYHTIMALPQAEDYEALKDGVNILTFTSSSTVRNFMSLTRDMDYGDPLVACIGPVTAATARSLGLRVDGVAGEYTIDGLLECLKELWPVCQ